MSAAVLPIARGSDFKSPNLATDWCIAHSSIDPSRKRIPKKKTGRAVVKQSPLIDVSFWAKKSRVDQKQLTCLNDSGKERSSVMAENTPTNASTEGEERLVVAMAEGSKNKNLYPAKDPIILVGVQRGRRWCESMDGK